MSYTLCPSPERIRATQRLTTANGVLFLQKQADPKQQSPDLMIQIVGCPLCGDDHIERVIAYGWSNRRLVLQRLRRGNVDTICPIACDRYWQLPQAERRAAGFYSFHMRLRIVDECGGVE